MKNRALYGMGLFTSVGLLVFGCSAEGASPDGGTGGSVTATGGTNATGGVSGTTGGVSGTTGGVSGTTGGVSGTTGGVSGTTGGVSGTTGGTASAGMAGGTAQGGTPAAGATGVGGATGCSDGCAELKVPFTAFQSGQAFEIYLPAPADFSAGLVNVKLRSTAGKAGGIQVVLKNGEANMYAWAQSSWLAITDTLKADWTTVTLDASAPGGMDMTNVFDKTAVTIVAIQISAGDPWYSDPPTNSVIDNTALVNPTTVQIDEITLTGVTGAGPWTFTAHVTDLKLGTYQPVVGSAATWLPPG